MTLIKSISGIRGIIGGIPGDGLTPVEIIRFTAAYTEFLKRNFGSEKLKIMVGRDARTSGEMVDKLVTGTLLGMGANVVNIELAATPTVEIAVTEEMANGGIIITASHNPDQWNALKLLNHKGEFLSSEDGENIMHIADKEGYCFAHSDDIGKLTYIKNYEDIHIEKILNLSLVDKTAIEKANFKIAVDAVNSVGGIVIPKLLKALGVKEIIELYCSPDGKFPHNPEPLSEHLTDISDAVIKNNADLGFVVDPDVDRLAIINEDGSMFGEEYTLVSVADYILKNKKGNTVSNISSSLALKDLTEKYGTSYYASAVGEVNVVECMRQNQAIIGGEGNGGVIYPELHYGRDALIGIALFLSHLAQLKLTCSQLRNSYPDYYISKNKMHLRQDINIDKILHKIKKNHKGHKINDIDGIRIDFDKEWVHLRKSNTEPIIRIYAESKTMEGAKNLANSFIDKIRKLIK